ncbi:PA2778 family cysteine peptidase [Halopseudomonas sabulinigri]|uniref:PA2778 family cysteine peptidase n=1 Tax=Halopseudomonas sabulinigri TaxID=472181 RepID=A0ABP9ZLP0_9GAMM
MRSLRILAALGLTALLSACAGTQTIPDAAQLPPDIQQQQRLDDVPFFAQDEYQCGPAALAMVLNQRHVDVTPAALKERVYIPERKGSLQVEMVAAARDQGMLVYPLEPELQAILSEVDAGNAVLVMQNLGLSWFPQWHYAVVVGYDLNAQELLLHSGLQEAQREPFKLFLRTWGRAENWARVIMPADTLPATAAPLPYLRAASDLEQTGKLDSAKDAYQTALIRWPEEPAARLGLGNVAWQQGDKSIAVAHFSELTRQFPALDAGWNNLITGLNDMGCEQAAKVAQQCFEQRSPSDAKNGQNAACPLPVCP